MFEYDPEKSAANLAKHGIDFDTAQSVWDDPASVEIEARSSTEHRFAVIGRIEDRHWTVFATGRGRNIWIISARRSRKAEVGLYETKDD